MANFLEVVGTFLLTLSLLFLIAPLIVELFLYSVTEIRESYREFKNVKIKNGRK
jgi:hypothetical protein